LKLRGRPFVYRAKLTNMFFVFFVFFVVKPLLDLLAMERTPQMSHHQSAKGASYAITASFRPHRTASGRRDSCSAIASASARSTAPASWSLPASSR